MSPKLILFILMANQALIQDYNSLIKIKATKNNEKVEKNRTDMFFSHPQTNKSQNHRFNMKKKSENFPNLHSIKSA